MSDDKTSDITLLSLGEPDKVAALVEQLRREMPHQIELDKLIAKIRRQRFLNYVAEGFTDAQALELCKI